VMEAHCMRVLTGLDEWLLHDLTEHMVTTFELISTDNVVTAMGLKKGEFVFLTHKGKEDIRPHMEGVFAEVQSVSTEYKKTMFKSQFLDEREVLSSRVQFRFIEHGVLRKAKDLGKGKGMESECELHRILG